MEDEILDKLRNVDGVHLKIRRPFEAAERSLCVKCTYGIVTITPNGVTQYCQYMCKKTPRCPILECTMYRDKYMPSVRDYEEIAWVLKTDPKRVVGFKPPENKGKREDPFD